MTLLGGIPHKRGSIARVMELSGMTALLEHAVRLRGPGLTVFTYHRIAEIGTNLFYDPVISATVGSFREQINWLCSRFKILSLDEVLAYLESGKGWQEPVALLTFDDGYRDNVDVAVPVLAERCVPATFFIPTAFLDKPQLPWWDYVAYVVKHTKKVLLTLRRDAYDNKPPLVIKVAGVSRAAAITAIIDAFLDETIADAPWFLEQLATIADVPVDSRNLSRALFMSWDQVEELSDKHTGITIGSHAHSHQRLASLTSEYQQFELKESKRILEARLGYQVMALAYPYGWAGTYTSVTKELAKQAGYRLAFASRQGYNRLSYFDRHEISRLGIGSADSSPLIRARTAFYTAFDRSPL